jgi:glycerol uptake facilitator protein
MGPFLGELLGTLILVLLGNGVVAGVLLTQSKSNNAGWIVITAGWAFAVMCGVFVSAATGSPPAALNPAVSIAVAVRNGNFANAMVEIAGQFIGAFIGATLVWLAYYQHWGVTKDPGLKLACFSTGPAIRNPIWNVVTEAIGTFVLLFVIFAIFSKAGNTAGSPAAGVGPYLVASLVWGVGLSLGGPTGYAINPARDLGPRIMHAILPIPGKGDSDWGYSWVPVVGPIIGGVIAALLANAVGM